MQAELTTKYYSIKRKNNPCYTLYFPFSKQVIKKEGKKKLDNPKCVRQKLQLLLII